MMKQVDEMRARRENELEEKRLAVKRDRAEIVEEKARMRAATPPPDCVVKLNVGGARFETSLDVLTKVEDSMLGRMFGRCDSMLQPADDGSIFIDRDGERFGMLLDFLRGGPPDGPRMQRAMRLLPEAAQQALAQELDYFGLEAAVFGVRPWTNGSTFRPGPSMLVGRAECAAVSVGGRVLVFCGGLTTEVLDTQTMAFTAGPGMLMGRIGCAAVQMDANRVLVVGGHNGTNLNTTEILDLTTLTLTPGPNMLSPRCNCAAVALDARRILVVGGCAVALVDAPLFTLLSSTEILSLDTMTFSQGPSMAIPRCRCAAVLVVGGHSGSEHKCLDTTEILDVRTMAFAPGPSMGSARCGCPAVAVDAQHVLVIGGLDSSVTALATTELLDVAMLEFAPGPALGTARASLMAVRLDAGRRPRIGRLLGGWWRRSRTIDDRAARGCKGRLNTLFTLEADLASGTSQRDAAPNGGDFASKVQKDFFATLWGPTRVGASASPPALGTRAKHWTLDC